MVPHQSYHMAFDTIAQSYGGYNGPVTTLKKGYQSILKISWAIPTKYRKK